VEAQELFSDVASRLKKRYRVKDIPSVRECGGTAIEYIREPELPKGAVVALTGDSGSGKSTLVTAWARDAGVPVLFLDRENPVTVIIDRLQRLGFEDGPHLRFWGGWLPEQAPLPDSSAVIEWVKSCSPNPLLVVDSLIAFHGGDENDAGQTRAFMHRCRRVADLGATVVVIHHDGKSETAKDFRGSSDFKAAIDLGFHVANFGDGRLDKIVLRPFKVRIQVAGEISYDYADGRFIRRGRSETQQPTCEQLTTILRLNPGVTSRKFEELAISRNIGRQRARDFVSAGLLAGSIRREVGTRNLKKHFLVRDDHVE
jgi:archaellum biogenesis ATPase FlaH